MKSDLIERYIYAVEKRLPPKLGGDIKKELETLIADMLEQRCGELPPAEHDVRVVLTELGTPAELAERYDPDVRRALIGPPYYQKYKTVLQIVLAATWGGLMIVGLIGLLSGSVQGHPLLLLAQGIGTLFMAGMNAFGFVTALFAFFEYKKVKLDEDDVLGDLPPVPVKDERIGRAEPIAGIIFSVIFLLVFLGVAPSFVGYFQDRAFVPLFREEELLKLWFLVALIFALSVVKESFKLIEGRYTRKLALVTLCTGLPSVVALGLLLSAPGVLNPAFFTGVAEIVHAEAGMAANVVNNIPLTFFVVAAAATLLDIVTAFFKAHKYRRTQ